MGIYVLYFLNHIIDQINWSVDKFLLGRIAGTTAVAVYGVGGQINTMYLQFSNSVSNVFVPEVNRIVAEKDDNRLLTDLLVKVGRIQFIILALILTGFIYIGLPFIKIWAGDGYSASYEIALLLIVPVTVPLIQNLGIEIQRAKNMHKARAVVYLLIAIANIFISIPLIELFGPAGAALGTALSLFAGNILFMNWYYQKKIGLDMVCFWKEIAKFIPALIAPTAAGVLIMKYARVSGWPQIVIYAAAYAAVYGLSMYFFGMNEEEKTVGEGADQENFEGEISADRKKDFPCTDQAGLERGKRIFDAVSSRMKLRKAFYSYSGEISGAYLMGLTT